MRDDRSAPGENNETSVLLSNEADADDTREEAVLFISQDRNISEHRLSDRQIIGRPTEDAKPEIAIQDRFISRRHGCFITDMGRTVFEAFKTTNGVLYHGRKLLSGEKMELKDGDELMIPAGENGEILLVYASSPSRIRFWRELKGAYMDQLTGLGNRDSRAAEFQAAKGLNAADRDKIFRRGLRVVDCVVDEFIAGRRGLLISCGRITERPLFACRGSRDIRAKLERVAVGNADVACAE